MACGSSLEREGETCSLAGSFYDHPIKSTAIFKVTFTPAQTTFRLAPQNASARTAGSKTALLSRYSDNNHSVTTVAVVIILSNLVTELKPMFQTIAERKLLVSAICCGVLSLSPY